MHGVSSIFLMVGLLAAGVSFDLFRTLRTGRAHTRTTTATRAHQPARYWRYVYADYVVLASCLVILLWAILWPDSFG
jgi:hypothetical protein